MKKRGGRFLIVLGAGLAAMAFIVVYLVTAKGIGDTKAAPEPTPVPMKSVVVVNQDVPAYTILDATNISTQEVEASTVQTDTTESPAMLFGKMTLVPMSRGQTVLANQVTTSGFSQILGKGKRAFTLAVNERNNFGGMLTENDYIDVLWTHKYEVSQFVPGADGKPQEKTRTLPTTKTLLQDVRVMRVITLNTPSTQQPRADGQNGAATQTAAVRAAPASQLYAADAVVSTVLILEVNDQQAEVLKFANEGGTLDFTLRSSDGTSRRGDADVRGDHDPERTTGITDKVLVEQYGLLLPELLIK